MKEITVDDIKSFSIFDDGYFYNVRYIGFSFEFKNTHCVDAIHKYKIYLESHGKIFYFTYIFGIPWNEYELLKLQFQELERPMNYTKTGNKFPKGCKHKYYINKQDDIVNAEFFSELFTFLPHCDYYCMEIHERFEGLYGNSCTRNDFAKFINEKLARG